MENGSLRIPLPGFEPSAITGAILKTTRRDAIVTVEPFH
jgi:hypothetical protein